MVAYPETNLLEREPTISPPEYIAEVSSMVTISSEQSSAKEFLNLFTLRVDSLIKHTSTGLWRTLSKYHDLSDEQILDSISDTPSNIRACKFATKTRFAVISIPENSPYATLDKFHHLVNVLSATGLRPKTYLAAGSRDIHLYLFFSEENDSLLVSEKLKELLALKGFDLSSDMLSVYPDQKNALPLPLQCGFEWLNNDLRSIIKRNQIPMNSALALFLSDLKKNASSTAGLFQVVNLLKLDLAQAEFWGLTTHVINIPKAKSIQHFDIAEEEHALLPADAAVINQDNHPRASSIAEIKKVGSNRCEHIDQATVRDQRNQPTDGIKQASSVNLKLATSLPATHVARKRHSVVLLMNIRIRHTRDSGRPPPILYVYPYHLNSRERQTNA